MSFYLPITVYALVSIEHELSLEKTKKNQNQKQKEENLIENTQIVEVIVISITSSVDRNFALLH